MSASAAALLPIAAVATGYVIRGVGDVVKQGASFLDMLRVEQANPAVTAASAAQADTSGPAALSSDSQQMRWKVVQQQFQSQLAAVQQLLVGKLAGSGIDLSEPLVLTSDADGRILATTSREDRAEIEQAIESDPKLTEQLRQLFQQVTNLESPSMPGAARRPDDVRLVVSPEQAYFTT